MWNGQQCSIKQFKIKENKEKGIYNIWKNKKQTWSSKF